MKFVYALLASLVLIGTAQADETRLQAAVAGEHRTAEYAARDEFRNPVETLSFLGVEPDMTVVEVWPGGGGWYTEILAPYLRDTGTFYAGQYAPGVVDFFDEALVTYGEKLAANPGVYDQTQVVHVFATQGPTEGVEDGSADAVLTFRNVHNWVNQGFEQAMFDEFYRMVKPGGVLGVVEHRADTGTDMETMKSSGYVTAEYVIELAQNSGFTLENQSEVNANPNDTKDYETGVWTLLPSLEGGEEYRHIGESDRMTMRFRKPAN